MASARIYDYVIGCGHKEFIAPVVDTASQAHSVHVDKCKRPTCITATMRCSAFASVSTLRRVL
eukprot:2206987-Pleurochrysis_carterae.AAC.1